MNCPKCGEEIGEGKAYCSNPACGAVTGAKPLQAGRSLKYEKEIKVSLQLDFRKLMLFLSAALAAAVAAYLYFSRR